MPTQFPTDNMSDAIQFPTDYTSDAIQEAIGSLPDSGGVVMLPAGVYLISDSLRLNKNVTLQGYGFGTFLQAASPTGLDGAIVRSSIQSADQATDDNDRREGLFIRDLAIDNRMIGRGIGIDFTRVSVGGIENVSIKNVKTGVRIKGAAFYNSFINIVVSDAAIGMEFCPETEGPVGMRSGANENRVFGSRMIGVDVGFDIESDNLHFFQCGVEASKDRPFTRGYRLRPHTDARKYTNGIGIFGPRFENRTLPGNDYGIEIGSGVTGTTIVAPYFGNVTTRVKDHGSIGTIIIHEGSVVLSSSNGNKWSLRVKDDGSIATMPWP